MAGGPAGAFKWRADEYFTKSGNTLHTHDWVDKECQKQQTIRFLSPAALRSKAGEAAAWRDDSSTPEVGSTRGSHRSGRGSVGPLRDLRPPAAAVQRAVYDGPKSWDWCLPPQRAPTTLAGAAQPHDNFQMSRSLTSPTTLSFHGAREAERLLGVSPIPEESRGRWGSASPLGDGLGPVTSARNDPGPSGGRARMAATTNQMYGFRNRDACRADKFHPKNHSDVSKFADSMLNTRTMYNASIRF